MCRVLFEMHWKRGAGMYEMCWENNREFDEIIFLILIQKSNMEVWHKNCIFYFMAYK